MMKRILKGLVRQVKAPRTLGELSGLQQVESLHLFEASFAKGQLCADHVANNEAGTEGLFYLALFRECIRNNHGLSNILLVDARLGHLSEVWCSNHYTQDVPPAAYADDQYMNRECRNC